MPHWAIIIDDGKPVNSTQGAVCRLPVSVGRMYYEGEALKDILQAVKKTFKFCIIHIADTLQARTIKITQPREVEGRAKEMSVARGLVFDNLPIQDKNALIEEASISIAQEKGREWLERNRSTIIEILGDKCKIDVWSEWTSHEFYSVYRASIERQYTDNPQFKRAVDVAATNFVAVLNTELKHGSVPPFDPELAGRENKEYIKEETTVVKLWQDEWARTLPTRDCSDEQRFVVVYPANTPAHRCMIECLNNLKIPELSTAMGATIPELEFFDIVFYCDRTESNPISEIKIYQVTSKIPRKEKAMAMQQLRERNPDLPVQQGFFAPSAHSPQSFLPKRILESTVRTFQEQMMFFITSIPPEDSLETCKQMIRFAQELQANTRARLKAKEREIQDSRDDSQLHDGPACRT